MDLIWHLGGYEKANAEYKGVKHLRDSAEVERGRVAFAVGILRQDLLEYRRKHNIFEDEDKVVHIYDSENSMLFTVKDITVHGYSFGNDWGWRGVISNMGVGHAFRHATDAEIKANRRLLVAKP